MTTTIKVKVALYDKKDGDDDKDNSGYIGTFTLHFARQPKKDDDFIHKGDIYIFVNTVTIPMRAHKKKT